MDKVENPSQIIDSLRININKITQNVNQIDGIILEIGTSKDSYEIRKKLLNLETNTKDLLAASQNKIKDLHNYSSTHSGELKLSKERLTDELIRALRRFQNSHKTGLEKQKAYQLPERSQPTPMFSKNEFSFDTSEVFEKKPSNQLQQKQMQQNLDLQSVIERQEKFQQLESDIVDLNSMFKDLAIITHDQGQVIDNIENNIITIQDSVESANTEIKGALTYQSKARRKKICIIISVIIALIILVLIIVLSTQPWKKK